MSKDNVQFCPRYCCTLSSVCNLDVLASTRCEPVQTIDRKQQSMESLGFHNPLTLSPLKEKLAKEYFIWITDFKDQMTHTFLCNFQICDTKY